MQADCQTTVPCLTQISDARDGSRVNEVLGKNYRAVAASMTFRSPDTTGTSTALASTAPALLMMRSVMRRPLLVGAAALNTLAPRFAPRVATPPIPNSA